MSIKILNKTRYSDFLLESHLAEGIYEKWFFDEVLARSILNVLVDKQLLSHADVTARYNLLAKRKLENVLNLDDAEYSANIPDSFFTTLNSLETETIQYFLKDAMYEFSNIITQVIPSAIIIKYKHKPVSPNGRQSFDNLCKKMICCSTIEDMYDIFITTSQRNQHIMVQTLVTTLDSLSEPLSGDTIITFPVDHLTRIKWFLTGKLHPDTLLM